MTTFLSILARCSLLLSKRNLLSVLSSFFIISTSVYLVLVCILALKEQDFSRYIPAANRVRVFGLKEHKSGRAGCTYYFG